ncbi:hypothetical protein AUG19_00460 [archaeon 13_1_20CM_2_54_9]|nr:MAG: hypothetical protein AUG19_00460 [archaeon 13_1_20CM_2_54_9]
MAGQVHLTTEKLIAQAEEKARSYEWPTAADQYKQALDRIRANNDPIQMGMISDLIAKSEYMAAFQANAREEFDQRMKSARDAYEKASDIYEGNGHKALSNMSKARATYSAFWLEDNPSHKQNLIADCIGLVKEAARIFESDGDREVLAQSQNDLITYISEVSSFSMDYKSTRDAFDTAVAVSDRAINDGTGVKGEVSLHFVRTINLDMDVRPFGESVKKIGSLMFDPWLWASVRYGSGRGERECSCCR